MPVMCLGKSVWRRPFGYSPLHGVREGLLSVCPSLWEERLTTPLLNINQALFLFVLSPFLLSYSAFSAASLGFYLFSPNHSDPVSITDAFN